MVKNRHLAKSIADVAWSQFSRMQAPRAAATASTFRHWLEYFGRKYGKLTIPVAPHNTSQNCSNCGEKVAKSLSTRRRSLPERLTHVCPSCGYTEDRDVNAARNILKKALSTVGQTESLKLAEIEPLLVLEQSCTRKFDL